MAAKQISASGTHLSTETSCAAGIFSLSQLSLVRLFEDSPRPLTSDAPPWTLVVSPMLLMVTPSLQVATCPNVEACTYVNRTANLSRIQEQVVRLSAAIQAALVLRPTLIAAAVDTHKNTTARRLLFQQHYQR